jgi:amidase
VLDAISGNVPGDAYLAPAPERPFARELGANPGAMRIGFITSSGLVPVHPDCAEAVERTASLLEELGHQVESVRVPALDRIETGPWIPAGVARDLDRWSEITGDPIGPEDVEPLNWMLAEIGRRLDGPTFLKQAEQAWSWAREVLQSWGRDFDLLLTPTTAIPPPELGWLSPSVPTNELMPRLGFTTCFTMPFDVTGQPAISLPMHWSDAGLPIGVQLVAPVGREDWLFRVGGQLEDANGWSERSPAVHA